MIISIMFLSQFEYKFFNINKKIFCEIRLNFLHIILGVSNIKYFNFSLSIPQMNIKTSTFFI